MIPSTSATAASPAEAAAAGAAPASRAAATSNALASSPLAFVRADPDMPNAHERQWLRMLQQDAAALGAVPPVDEDIRSCLLSGSPTLISSMFNALARVVDLRATGAALLDESLRLVQSFGQPADSVVVRLKIIARAFQVDPTALLHQGIAANDRELALAAVRLDPTIVDESIIRQLRGFTLSSVAIDALELNPELVRTLPFEVLADATVRLPSDGCHDPLSRSLLWLNAIRMFPSRAVDFALDADQAGHGHPSLWDAVLELAPRPRPSGFDEWAQARSRELPESAPWASEFDDDKAATGRLTEVMAATLQNPRFNEREIGAKCFMGLILMRQFPKWADEIVLHLASGYQDEDLHWAEALRRGPLPHSLQFWTVAVAYHSDEVLQSLPLRPEAIGAGLLLAAIARRRTDVLDKACELRPEAMYERLTVDGPTAIDRVAQLGDYRMRDVLYKHGAPVDAFGNLLTSSSAPARAPAVAAPATLP